MVIISGGSWAVGEWKLHQLSGPGLAHYFNCAGYRTVDLSMSSIGNTRQVELIQEFIHDSGPCHTDCFYWLVHSPLVDVPTEQIYQGKTSLTESINSLLISQLEYANHVAKNNNIKINLIGASCDLNTIPVFEHLNVVVPSWGQLLNNTYPASVFGHQTDHMTELRQELKQHRPDLVEEYYRIGGMAFGKRRIMTRCEDLFQSFHPTSKAHKILSDYLITSFH
jgi:hypothetical protein